MIQVLVWGLLSGLGGFLVFQVKTYRAAASTAVRQRNVLTVAVKGLEGKQRWRNGRVRRVEGAVTWQPWLRIGPTLTLPPDLHPMSQRSPRGTETWVVNPGAVVIECRSSAGDLSIGFMPWDMEDVQRLLWPS
ncbi:MULTISPECIES: hypothetical protein [unclassified Streptomyces]|uniref:hypothetical protein n=1 Tax=unclassified Streptomyces TaxID=2593676 RepID=UPI001660FF2B|nr:MULTISPECIES: hypothetical protein [unclassified Streptomyces]MBD0707758.1 hypothetical protein [Streptomyces sp. CBMA291]MBD0714907.1 hypothetical protein [Streptomyces sp. CBMA370]